MIKVHIPSEQYGFIEIEYESMTDFSEAYTRDYINVATQQVRAKKELANMAKNEIQTRETPVPKS